MTVRVRFLGCLVPLISACGGAEPTPTTPPATSSATAAPVAAASAATARPTADAPAAPASAQPRASDAVAAAPSAAAARPSSTAPAATASAKRVAVVTPPAPPPPPKRERVRMYNACNKPVRLEFKRPGADLSTSLNTSTFEEFPATDGDQIHIMDDTGRNVIDRLTIASSMKEVHVASGCVKLEGK